MLADAKTDIGLVREINEDSYAFLPPQLFVVADGMGGHAAGEIASKNAIRQIIEYIDENKDREMPEVLLEAAIRQANQVIYEMAQSNDTYLGMGTTVTLAYVIGDTIYWGHVGDSRMYLVHSGEMIQVTTDHSLVWELVASGTITREEAYTHPQRNLLTRAVGTSKSIRIDVGHTTWGLGDSILLCTDGLTNMVSEQDICQTVINGINNGQRIAEQLIEQAKNAGGSDNITAIFIPYVVDEGA